MKKYSSYQEAEAIAVRLFYQQKHQEAIELLKDLMEKFPEKLHEINWSLAFNYCLNGQYEESLEMFDYSLKKGIFFPFHPEINIWEPLEKYDSQRFKKIIEKTRQLRDQAQKKAKPKLEVLLPEKYSDNEKYPLFIVLPGWGGDIEFSQRHWNSHRLRKEFIVAYMQSSQVVQTQGFAWDDIPLGRKEIKQLYEQTVKDYAVDVDKVIIGGYSQGGMMVMDIIFNRAIPLKGFVAVCPGGSIPEALTKGNAAKAAEKGVKGYIISGEKDDFLPEQEEIIKILKEADFPYQMEVMPGMYHWFPSDFGKQLDLAIEDVLGY
ncbi:MAG: dienelactone hydrolase family protein [Candidatus Aminicenantes bacterium]|jgi:predicted esterase